MQLVPFETMLVDLLNGSGQVRQAVSFQQFGYPLLYGCSVQTSDGATVHVRLTRGSGTGDVKRTEEEEAAHAANVARLADAGQPPRLSATPEQNRQVEGLIRQLLLDAPVAGATSVDVWPDGKPGFKIRFDTASEIYVTAIDR